MSRHKKGEWHTDAKRIEVVTSYLVLGKAHLVEAMTGVPVGTIRRWKTEPWWNELVTQIQMESDQELDAKLASRLAKTLDIINDRLDNGDFVFNPRTGEFGRRPVTMKDTWKVAKEVVDLRMILRKQPAQVVNQEAVGDILKNLAKEFADMARQRVKEVIKEEAVDGTGLQTGVRPIAGETGANPETSTS